MKLLLKFIGFVIFLMILVAVYATFIEPNLLMTRNYSMSFDKIQGDSIKVVQFTDTHLGDFFDIEQLERVVDLINEQDADVVVFTGDLLDNANTYNGDFEAIGAVLSQIEAKYGKFAVKGNRDNGGGAEWIYPGLMETAGFTLLVNEQQRLTINGTTVNMMGTDDILLGNYDPKATVEGIREADVNILLVHEPDLIKDFVDYPIDLALAGHSHGGQVYIPFYGPLLKTVKAEIYVRGLYEIEGEFDTLLYVNTGLGNTRLPFRFFNIPNITVFELEAS